MAEKVQLCFPIRPHRLVVRPKEDKQYRPALCFVLRDEDIYVIRSVHPKIRRARVRVDRTHGGAEKAAADVPEEHQQRPQLAAAAGVDVWMCACLNECLYVCLCMYVCMFVCVYVCIDR